MKLYEHDQELVEMLNPETDISRLICSLGGSNEMPHSNSIGKQDRKLTRWQAKEQSLTGSPGMVLTQSTHRKCMGSSSEYAASTRFSCLGPSTNSGSTLPPQSSARLLSTLQATR